MNTYEYVLTGMWGKLIQIKLVCLHQIFTLAVVLLGKLISDDKNSSYIQNYYKECDAVLIGLY